MDKIILSLLYQEKGTVDKMTLFSIIYALNAGVVQWLVYVLAKDEMTVRFRSPAPNSLKQPIVYRRYYRKLAICDKLRKIAGWSNWQLVGLITRRFPVRVRVPQRSEGQLNKLSLFVSNHYLSHINCFLKRCS